MVVATGMQTDLKKLIITMIANITCNGEPSFSLFGCVNNGTMCTDNGNCSTSGVCVCDNGWEGRHCQIATSASSSDSTGLILGVTLGVALPGLCLLITALIGVIVGLLAHMERKRRAKDDWEIDADELDMGEQVGAGGYGTVHRAKWRGTEVAVKMMPGEEITREMERNFKEEV
jgi:hypothetical protein